MRRLSERNKRPVYYALYEGITETSEDELYTGENIPQYSDVVLERMVVGPNSGTAALEQFGIYDPFSVKIYTDNESCRIDTSSVLWLGFDALKGYDSSETYSDGDTVIKNGKIVRYNADDDLFEDVPHTHIVQRVNKSFGYISYLAKEVEVSSLG